MLPVIASVNSFNFQTPIVNTVTPGTSVVHVPYDNVAPSVSSAQVDNNSNPAIALPTPDSEEQQPANNATTVQATFVAQLAAQDSSSPQTQVILVQYEKLVAISNVKFRPSNASKPQDNPANAFGRILTSEKAPAPAQTPQPQAHASEDIAVSLPVETVNVAPQAAKAAESAPAASEAAVTADTTPPATAEAIPPHVIDAYASTAARVDSFQNPAAQLA